MKKRSLHILLILTCLVTGCGVFLSCVKEAELPLVVTNEVINFKTTSATFNGLVTNDGGAKVDLKGFCFGTADNPTITNSMFCYCKGGTGSFTADVFHIVPDTYYHVRAFAMNSEGTAYGNEVHFKSLPLVEPRVTTTSVSFIRNTLARVNGNIESNDETLIFDKGFCLSTKENPTNKDRIIQNKSGMGRYFSWLEGLQPGTVYHVRAYAVSLLGINYGADISFKTHNPPIVITAVTEFTETSATVEGKITWPEDSLGKIWDWGIYY